MFHLVRARLSGGGYRPRHPAGLVISRAAIEPWRHGTISTSVQF